MPAPIVALANDAMLPPAGTFADSMVPSSVVTEVVDPDAANKYVSVGTVITLFCAAVAGSADRAQRGFDRPGRQASTL